MLTSSNVCDWHNKKTRDGYLEALRKQYFSNSAAKRKDPKERNVQQLKLAGNVLIGLRNYQLIENDNSSIRLTEVGQNLISSPSTAAAKETFAKHILTPPLCGQELILAIARLKERGISSRNKKHLAQELTLLGVVTRQKRPVSDSTTDHTKMASWLRWCGLLDENDNLVESLYEKLVGRSSSFELAVKRLSSEQKLFLRAFYEEVETSDQTTFLVKGIRQRAEDKFGTFIEKPDQLAATIIKPLQELEIVEHVRKSAGRGGSSGEIRPGKNYALVVDADLLVTPELTTKQPGVSKPLAKIFEELESANTHVKGIALEQLCITIGYALGLSFIGFRVRSSDTSGSEVDVIFETSGLTYAKWIFQCKNTPTQKVHVSAVAKEVGNAVILRANVVCLVTTGSYTKAVHDFARDALKTTNLQILLIEGKDLEKCEVKESLQ